MSDAGIVHVDTQEDGGAAAVYEGEKDSVTNAQAVLSALYSPNLFGEQVIVAQQLPDQDLPLHVIRMPKAQAVAWARELLRILQEES